MNAADWAYLDRIREQQRAAQPQAPEPQMGFLEYAGKRLANIPNNVAASIGDTVAAGLDFLTGKPAELRQEEARQREMGRGNYLGSAVGAQASAFDLPAPQGVGQKTLNILTSVGEELPGLLAPASAIGKGARLFGAGRAAPVIGGAGAGALSGYRDSAGEAGMQAAEFGLMEAAGALLPPGTRALRRAAVEATAGVPIAVGGQMLRGNDPLSTESLIQTGTQAAFPFGMQARRIFRERGAPRPEAMRPPDPMAPEAPPVSPADLSTIGSYEVPGGGYRTRMRTQDGVMEVASDTPEGNLIRPMGRVPDDLSTVGPVEGDVFANARKRILRDPISAEPAGEAVRPNTAESAVPPAQGRLRPLASGESGSIDYRLIAPIAGAAAGYAVNGGEGAAIGAGIGLLPGAAGAIGRRLLRRTGRSLDANVEGSVMGTEGRTLGQRVVGSAARAGEKLFKARRSANLDTAQQQAKGLVGRVIGDVEEAKRAAAKEYATLTPAQKGVVNLYLRSDRKAPAKAMLRRANLPEATQRFVETMEGGKREFQEVVRDARPDKADLIGDTLGSWQYMPYEAYHSPDTWAPSQMKIDALVAHNRKLDEYKGFSDAVIRKDIQEYVQAIRAKGGDLAQVTLPPSNRMSKQLFIGRKKLPRELREFLGEITNPIERELASINRLARSAETGKLINELSSLKDEQGRAFVMNRGDWDLAVQDAVARGDTAASEYLRHNFENVPDNPEFGHMKGKLAQRQVLDALGIGKGHKVPNWGEKIFGWLSAAQRVPKASFTVLNPATHIHNIAQTPMMAMTAGVNPVAMVRNLHELGDPKNAKWLKWAREDGMFDANLSAAEFRSGSDNWAEMLNPGVKERVGEVWRATKNLYAKPDQWARGAAYVKFLKEGLGDMKLSDKKARAYATEMTNRYTQNYANVSGIVNIARNIPLVNPFISYFAEMVRITKNLAADVINDPMKAKYGRSQRGAAIVKLGMLFGTGALLAQVAEKGARLFGLKEEDQERLKNMAPYLPAYMRGKTMAGVSMDEKGRGGFLNLNPWLPAEDITTMAKNILSGDWDAFLSNNPVFGSRNPLISAGAEMITGRDPFTGKESSGYQRYIEPVLQNTLPPWMPPTGHLAKKFGQAFTRNEEGELGVTDERGRRETPATALLSAAGVSIAKIDEKRLLRAKANDQKRLLAEAAARRNKVLRSDINAAAKDAARAEYQEERRRILGR